MLPIFLVSLEHHQNRRDKVFAGLQKYGINDAIWFPAVNGNKEDLTKFNIDRSKHQRFWHNSISCCSYNRVYTNGEYGCALSHLHLYQKIVDEKGLKQVTDTSAIEAVIDEVLAANPDNAAAYRNGKQGLFGWFVGQVMKASKGKANPGLVNELLKKKLG